MRPTTAERREAGRALREELPFDAHAEWEPVERRPDPVDLLVAGTDDLLADLLPIRWNRMAQSAFAFFRGSAELMAGDLGAVPSSPMAVQLCGDAHLANFGGFATTERNFVFDLNDFDETLPGPFEWDVKRLAASVVVAGRDRALDEKSCTDAAALAVRSYRRWMAKYAEMSVLEVWYSRIDATEAVASIKSADAATKRKGLAKARGRTSARLLPKLTSLTDEGRRINPAPPLVVPLRDERLREATLELVGTYANELSSALRHLLARYEVVDVALKVVGVGSVGTRCFIVLLDGRDEDDVLFLQVKEARPSALQDHLPPSEFTHEGERVVSGQRLAQAAGDPFLGWASAAGRPYYVRQLRDMKSSFDLTRLTTRSLGEYAALCGWALSRAHARSGDPVTITGYLGGSSRFDRAVAAGAAGYADLAELDYEVLLEALESGRLIASEEGEPLNGG